jgi:hypothetical protein
MFVCMFVLATSNQLYTGPRNWSFVGIVTGNPGVFQGYPYPYPSIPLPFVVGPGFNGLGSGVMRVQRVQKPAGGLASTWFFSMEHDGYICK